MWLVLAPASMIVVALVVLTVGLHAVEAELAALRRSLRRTQATAVASDDLSRSAARVMERADDLAASTRQRVGVGTRWWAQPREIGR